MFSLFNIIIGKLPSASDVAKLVVPAHAEPPESLEPPAESLGIPLESLRNPSKMLQNLTMYPMLCVCVFVHFRIKMLQHRGEAGEAGALKH